MGRDGFPRGGTRVRLVAARDARRDPRRDCGPPPRQPRLASSVAGHVTRTSAMAGHAPAVKPAPLTLLSVVIPARDEEGCIASTVRHLHVELHERKVPHEIVVVDDGSRDRTWEILQELRAQIPVLQPTQVTGEHGIGRAIVHGFGVAQGDAVVVMMADESDDCRDVVTYWTK